MKSNVLQIMKHLKVFIILTVATALSGCYSGFTIAQMGDGKLIAYEELRKFDSGSLSTVWYQGSDEEFHYFVHFIKTSTRYRVRKEEVEIVKEFPKGSDSIHIMEANGELERIAERMRERMAIGQ